MDAKTIAVGWRKQRGNERSLCSSPVLTGTTVRPSAETKTLLNIGILSPHWNWCPITPHVKRIFYKVSFTVNTVQRTVGESVLLVGELVWSTEGGAAVSPLSWIISIRGECAVKLSSFLTRTVLVWLQTLKGWKYFLLKRVSLFSKKQDNKRCLEQASADHKSVI